MPLSQGQTKVRKISGVISSSRRRPFSRCYLPSTVAFPCCSHSLVVLVIRGHTVVAAWLDRIGAHQPQLHGPASVDFFVRESRIRRFPDSVTIRVDGHSRVKSAKRWNCNDFTDHHLATEHACNVRRAFRDGFAVRERGIGGFRDSVTGILATERVCND